MKKILGLLSIALVFILLVGCSNNNSAQVKLASQKLSNGIDKMITQVNKLEEVDEEKLKLDDILGDYYTEYQNSQKNILQNDYVSQENMVDSSNSQNDFQNKYVNMETGRTPLMFNVPSKTKAHQIVPHSLFLSWKHNRTNA